jgi:hypothetical protein
LGAASAASVGVVNYPRARCAQAATIALRRLRAHASRPRR